jgi:hypothetical protein
MKDCNIRNDKEIFHLKNGCLTSWNVSVAITWIFNDEFLRICFLSFCQSETFLFDFLTIFLRICLYFWWSNWIWRNEILMNLCMCKVFVFTQSNYVSLTTKFIKNFCSNGIIKNIQKVHKNSPLVSQVHYKTNQQTVKKFQPKKSHSIFSSLQIL